MKEGFIIVERLGMDNAMMSQQPTRMELPAELDSPRAKLVYLYLQTHGQASLDELQVGLGMRKLSLYSILGTLSERGLVEGEAEQYVVN